MWFRAAGSWAVLERKMPVSELLKKRCWLPHAGLLVLLFVASAWADKRPLIPFPDDVRITVVGEDLKVYGLPLMAYEFHSPETVEAVAGFYTAAWNTNSAASDADEPYIETELAGWKVLSRLELGHNITVQLRDTGIGGTQVLVGVSPLPTYLLTKRRNRVDINVPLLGGARVTSVVASSDRRKLSEVYWLISDDSVDAFLGRYRRHHEGSGATVSGYRLVKEEGYRALAGSLQVSTGQGSYRYDAMAADDSKTHVTAIWSPQ